jgi:hypothetical protein
MTRALQGYQRSVIFNGTMAGVFREPPELSRLIYKAMFGEPELAFF